MTLEIMLGRTTALVLALGGILGYLALRQSGGTAGLVQPGAQALKVPPVPPTPQTSPETHEQMCCDDCDKYVNDLDHVQVY